MKAKPTKSGTSAKGQQTHTAQTRDPKSAKAQSVSAGNRWKPEWTEAQAVAFIKSKLGSAGKGMVEVANLEKKLAFVSKTTTGNYWDAGEALTPIHGDRIKKHGQWAKFLKQHGLNKKTVLVALHIFRRSPNREAAVALPLATAKERWAYSEQSSADRRKAATKAGKSATVKAESNAGRLSDGSHAGSTQVRQNVQPVEMTHAQILERCDIELEKMLGRPKPIGVALDTALHFHAKVQETMNRLIRQWIGQPTAAGLQPGFRSGYPAEGPTFGIGSRFV